MVLKSIPILDGHQTLFGRDKLRKDVPRPRESWMVKKNVNTVNSDLPSQKRIGLKEMASVAVWVNRTTPLFLSHPVFGTNCVALVAKHQVLLMNDGSGY